MSLDSAVFHLAVKRNIEQVMASRLSVSSIVVVILLNKVCLQCVLARFDRSLVQLAREGNYYHLRKDYAALHQHGPPRRGWVFTIKKPLCSGKRSLITTN
jgi:hypothetical protein